MSDPEGQQGQRCLEGGSPRDRLSALSWDRAAPAGLSVRKPGGCPAPGIVVTLGPTWRGPLEKARRRGLTQGAGCGVRGRGRAVDQAWESTWPGGGGGEQARAEATDPSGSSCPTCSSAPGKRASRGRPGGPGPSQEKLSVKGPRDPGPVQMTTRKVQGQERGTKDWKMLHESPKWLPWQSYGEKEFTPTPPTWAGLEPAVSAAPGP